MFLESNNKTDNKIHTLQERARMLHLVRDFFYQRKILEVDCPALSSYASIDAHIDLIQTQTSSTESGFLHSSPEYGMKKLLSMGLGDIYQLSHVFRKEEKGRLHNTEFTMIEWYRADLTYFEFMQETLELISLFLEKRESEMISYKDAFITYLDIDPSHASLQDLIKIVEKKSAIGSIPDLCMDSILDYLWSYFIEPNLGIEKYTIVIDFPSTMAALAKTYWNRDEKVAKRFEVYYSGVELANGYDELTDPEELKSRLQQENFRREVLGKAKLPLDPTFLEAMEKGIPSCYGVAVGFDRLLQLMLEKETIQEILSLPNF